MKVVAIILGVLVVGFLATLVAIPISKRIKALKESYGKD